MHWMRFCLPANAVLRVLKHKRQLLEVRYSPSQAQEIRTMGIQCCGVFASIARLEADIAYCRRVIPRSTTNCKCHLCKHDPVPSDAFRCL